MANISSGVSLAIQPFLPNYKIVFVTTGCASIALTDNVKKDYAKYKYFFRNMINSDFRQQKWAFKFLKEFVNGTLGYKKFAIVAENAKWTEEYAPNLKKKPGRGWARSCPSCERFDVDMKDFSPMFSKIKSLNDSMDCPDRQPCGQHLPREGVAGQQTRAHGVVRCYQAWIQNFGK